MKESALNLFQVCYFPSIIASRWLAIRLEFLGNLVTLAAALLIIVQPDVVSPSQVGLVIIYSHNVTQVSMGSRQGFVGLKPIAFRF